MWKWCTPLHPQFTNLGTLAQWLFSKLTILSPAKHFTSVLYCPPPSSFTFLDRFCTAIQSISPTLFFKLCIAHIFVDWKLSCKCSQVVNTHTHTAPSGKTSLIDLALVSNLEVLLNCSTVSPLK